MKNKRKILDYFYIISLTIFSACWTIILGFTFGYAFAYVFGWIH